MILMANFMAALARIIHILLMIYIWVVIIRAILSWVNVPSLYPVHVILYHLTEPVMRPLRRVVPPSRLGGIDISPILIVLIILFVDSFLVQSLDAYARQMLLKRELPF